MVLDKIQQWNDIKKLTPEELQTLRREIRRFLIDLAEKTGVESLKARENRMYTYGIEFH